MTGMALFQGLLDREGRVLDKANRLARAGFASLDANAPARAAGAFLKALGLLEAIEPTARTGDFADSFANVGTGLLRVGRFESAQAAATRALSADGGNANGLGLQGAILVAQGKTPDALAYHDAGRRFVRTAAGVALSRQRNPD